ncbi:helix-turn-helix domain-containing protein [Propionibacterium freudenreichii]|uniref:helix-turn-helix domain-containing protein n=1 Tax=Propionibacterium freudenreichii TaxID=1744 RepID=UPI0038552F8F
MTVEESRAVRRRRAKLLYDDHADMLDKLIEIRKTHHLSQADVAERMGVSQPAVSQLESDDSNPRLGTVRRYAHAVGALLRTEVIDDGPRPASREPFDFQRIPTDGEDAQLPRILKTTWSHRTLDMAGASR